MAALNKIGSLLLVTSAWGLSAFIVEDITATLKLLRVPVGILSGTFLIASGFAHLLMLAGIVAAFFVGFGYLSFSLYDFISENLSDLTSSISGDWYDFISYTLNFKVIFSFSTIYYYVFCSITVSFLALYFLSVVSKFLPAFLALVNRSIKLMTGN